MLDSETKRRLDRLRDILVGKVPDPKSQVDQITTGLIYKFMYDMDTVSAEAGGNRRFFKGEFRKYSWEKLFDPKVGGVERVKLYGEAIERMYMHPSAPPLFREIFKNSYLPFRDASTLNMFLTEIGEFHYSHSEKLGDAFEYLLSYMGSQGDAGQFRTPRHIIDFIVEIVDPKKNETILDPACGTAGFLISSYKHIMKDKKKLTALDLKKLSENLVGYDISPDMTRMSLVNMYLHNFPNPKIFEYDTLSSDDRWNEYYDVILANPPFFSPKGGIQPHSRFGVDSKRAEVLFVDYIIQHLKPNGRAGIIVPEGIIFQTGRAYKALRKKLVEDCLVGVISLPAGVFQPYSGVKTSILILDRKFSQSSEYIHFAEIKNDGFSLGAQRTPVNGSELPDTIGKFKKLWLSNSSSQVPRIHKSKILGSGDVGLSLRRYLDDRSEHFSYPPVAIGEICEIFNGSTPNRKINYYWMDGDVPWFTIDDIRKQGHEIRWTNQKITNKALKETSVTLLPSESTLLCCTASVGACAFSTIPVTTNQQFNGLVVKRKYQNLVNRKFLFWMATNLKSELVRHSGSTSFNFISVRKLKEITIPLPPIEIQHEIVQELDGYQKIIDGARQVVENYKPMFEVIGSWPQVAAQSTFSVVTATKKVLSKDFKVEGSIPIVDQSSKFIAGYWDNEEDCTIVHSPVVIFGDHTKILKFVDFDFVAGADGIKILNPNSDIIPKFLYYSLRGLRLPDLGYSRHFKELKTKTISLPPTEIQQSIVDELDEQAKVVEGNKKLIETYIKKIEDRMAKVWGD